MEGKITIFNLITGLIKPNSGKIIINGEIVNEYPVYLERKILKLVLFHNMVVSSAI